MVKIDYGSIVDKDILKIKNNKELEKYYENKWKKEGYKKGVKIYGINISNIYQKEREKSAFKFLEPKKADIILDAGCGKGKLALKISKKCKKIYGVDITKNAFLNIKKKPPKNLVFKKMNLEKLKFKDNFFDKIVCVETLEHVLHPKKVIKGFSGVLKPKGKLIITYPTINTNYMAKIQEFLKIRKPLKISEHLTEWSYDELVKEFEKKRFKLIKSEGVALSLGKLEKLLLETSKKMTRITTDFLISVKKFPRLSSFISVEFEKK